MFFTGHLPTKRFSHVDWAEMPVLESENNLCIAPDGWSRSRMNGKPICIYMSEDSISGAFAVRPIVRVKMGRRVVTDDEQADYEKSMRSRTLLSEWYTDYLKRKCEEIAA